MMGRYCRVLLALRSRCAAAAYRDGTYANSASDHTRGAVPGRRRQRRAGASGRRAHEQDARPAGRGREPRRRRRHGRDARDRQGPARRPTILLSYTGTFAINPTLYPNAGYDPRKDFAPIGSIGTLTSVLVAHPSLPVKSTADLIDYAKANPGKINYGFVPGTVGHISTEMFARSAGIKLTNIPYKGNGNAIADLMGGHVQMMFISILPVIGQIQGGKLNALAVASPARSSLVPNVPTIAESGVPGFSAVISYGLAAPAGTPRADRRAAEQGAAARARGRDPAQTARCRRRRGAAGHARGLRRDDRQRGERSGARW